jgi:hypothetical protein
MIGAAKHTDTGIIDTLYWAFDSMNRTGGTLSSDLPPGNQNNIAIATTLSDRYFIKQTDTQGNYIFAPVSKDGDYFEILWNGAGSFNHSWGLAAMNAAGPQWVSPGFATLSVSNIPTGTAKIIGMQRLGDIFHSFVNGSLYATLNIPAGSWYWAVSAVLGAKYTLLRPSQFHYSGI